MYTSPPNTPHTSEKKRKKTVPAGPPKSGVFTIFPSSYAPQNVSSGEQFPDHCDHTTLLSNVTVRNFEFSHSLRILVPEVNLKNLGYGVALVSRLLKNTGLFCKRALYKKGYSAKETYTFKEPADRSHPIFNPTGRGTTIQGWIGGYILAYTCIYIYIYIYIYIHVYIYVYKCIC